MEGFWRGRLLDVRGFQISLNLGCTATQPVLWRCPSSPGQPATSVLVVACCCWRQKAVYVRSERHGQRESISGRTTHPTSRPVTATTQAPHPNPYQLKPVLFPPHPSTPLSILLPPPQIDTIHHSISTTVSPLFRFCYPTFCSFFLFLSLFPP